MVKKEENEIAAHQMNLFEDPGDFDYTIFTFTLNNMHNTLCNDTN